MKLRLQPIRVFVFHQVSDSFDENTMWKCDWTETERFKNNIISISNQYEFIPLTQAVKHLREDHIRRKKYAVLTNDDGWQSLNNILPWLYENKIPITLFLNPAYLLKLEKRESNRENLLSFEDVFSLVNTYNNITIGSHGWSHRLCREYTFDEFAEMVDNSEHILDCIPHKIPFFAYPCGNYTEEMNMLLQKKSLIPVLCDGQVNFAPEIIHRECIDGCMFE